MNRLLALQAMTWTAIFLILIHGLYHIAEASQGLAARVIYRALEPFFAPTALGWAVHVAVELMALAALAFAIGEYRRASHDRDVEEALTDTEAEFDL